MSKQKKSKTPVDAATACSPSSDTPETDNLRKKLWGKGWSDSYMTMMSHANKLERERDQARKWNAEGKINGARCAEERDRLQDAVREYRDAKGRYHTQKACERLVALLPENS